MLKINLSKVHFLFSLHFLWNLGVYLLLRNLYLQLVILMSEYKQKLVNSDLSKYISVALKMHHPL